MKNYGRYRKVDYGEMTRRVRVAVAMNGQKMKLRDVVDSLCKYTGLNLDLKEIQYRLGNRCVEVVEQCGDVRRVTTWVCPR